MKIIDLHQDLLPYEKYKKDAWVKDQTSWEGLDKNNFKITLPTANSWDYFDWESGKPEPRLNDLITKEFLNYKEYCENSDIFELIKNQNDFDKVWNDENKKGIILHLEGIDYFEDKKEYWEMLEKWYQYGWRSIGTVWNIENSLAGGTNTTEIGLKELGKKVLSWAIEKEMIVDYAHMNDKVFWDTREFLKENFPEEYKKPVYVSHSAVRKFMDNERNLTDEQLLEIKKTNGVVGIFFSSRFIKETADVSIEDYIEQINYVKDLIGIDYIAVGTDLGGFSKETIKGLSKVDEISNLEKALKENGYSREEIEKIYYKNAHRVLKELLVK